MALVKVCGITNLDDALFAKSAGADFLGFIVDVPVETPRKISLQKAEDMLAGLKGVKCVVVLMPSTLRQVEAALDLKPFAVQLHRFETSDFVNQVKDIVGKTRLIKALHIEKSSTFEDVRKQAVLYAPFVDYFILDTKTEKVGGTGVTHDWNVSKGLVESLSKPVFLSGGLNPGNVRSAVETVKPYAVDVSSGVEFKPGFKDESSILEFINEVRECSV